MTTENTPTDTDAILAEATPLTLSTGTNVRVQRLKTIQMLRLLRIFTKGIGDITALNLNVDDEDFGQTLLSIALMAIPEAEQETIEFVQSLVEPVDLIKEPKSKADREKNTEVLTAFFLETQNPELEDLIDILEVVIKNEAPHVIALGKRIAALVTAQTKSAAAKSGAKSK